MINRLLMVCAVACVAFFGSSSAPAAAGTGAAQNTSSSTSSSSIVQIAAGDSKLSSLVKALEATGLVSTLEGSGPFTVFAPTNEAFAKLPPGLLSYLLANPSVLKTVLLYHVAAGADSLSPSAITTVQGEQVFPAFWFGDSGADFTVNNSVIVGKPIQASNGVIYIIDSVLLPQFR